MSDESTVQLGYQELEDHNTLMQLIRTLIHRTDELQSQYETGGVIAHNESDTAHADIRQLVTNLSNYVDNLAVGTQASTDLDNLRSEINDSINNINSELTALENRVNNINTSSTGTDTKIKNLRTEILNLINNINSELTALENRIDGLVISGGGTDTEVTGVLNNISSKVSALENRVNDIDDVNNTQSNRLDSVEQELSLKIYDSDVSGVGHTGDFDDLMNRPDIVINDADSSNAGVAVKLSKNRIDLKLPSTIKADIIGKISGDMTGNAATATKLQTARSINGTNFDGSGNITTTNWGTARNISIQDHNAGHTGSAVSVNGSGNVTLKLPSTINADVVGYLTGNISGSSTSCSGKAATATVLQTARSINGTNFDGSSNITTANWGTARNVSIQDHNAGHTGSAVSVNGSGNVTLKLPSTINADVVGYLTGNISGSAGSVAWTNVSGRPTALSQFSNDSGFLTTHQSLSNYSTLANTIKSLSISGTAITYTKGDNTTETLTTQDTIYSHPTSSGNKHIPSGGSSGQFLGWSADGTAKWVNNPNTNTTYSAGSNLSLSGTTFSVSSTPSFTNITINGYTITVD